MYPVLSDTMHGAHLFEGAELSMDWRQIIPFTTNALFDTDSRPRRCPHASLRLIAPTCQLTYAPMMHQPLLLGAGMWCCGDVGRVTAITARVASIALRISISRIDSDPVVGCNHRPMPMSHTLSSVAYVLQSLKHFSLIAYLSVCLCRLNALKHVFSNQ